jgi:hypothetical protein
MEMLGGYDVRSIVNAPVDSSSVSENWSCGDRITGCCIAGKQDSGCPSAVVIES